jgi:DNA invertase Pin-like site-specific DNA recombinase
MTATAWTYLRVSSSGQTHRAFSDEGYSIEAQRGDCARKARTLEAEITEEFVELAESARTDRRPALNAMLTRLRAGDVPTYVIFHKVDRFARNRRDDANMWFEMVESGTEVVSATENIDSSPAGRLNHGILATIAEYYSLNLSNEAKKGLHQKAKLGGTPMRARLGYLNVRKLINGAEVRTIDVDPERADHLRWAFQHYATGAYTLDTLLVKLTERGLTTRPTPKRPIPGPIGRSTLAAILADPYYIGTVRYGGKEYQGRHEHLIDRATFDRVQAVLEAHNRSGDKSWKHHHYLKGLLYCGRCGARLTFVNAKGNGGTYPYFACIGRIKGTGCKQPYIPTETVECKIAEQYRRILFAPLGSEQTSTHVAHIEEVRQLFRRAIAGLVAHNKQEANRLRRKIADLRRQRDKLMDAYLEGLPPDLVRRKADAVSRDLAAAERHLAAAESDLKKLLGTIELALDVLRDAVAAYCSASSLERRQWNQALFTRITIRDAEPEEAELAEPFESFLKPDLKRELFAAVKGPHPGPFSRTGFKREAHSRGDRI